MSWRRSKWCEIEEHIVCPNYYLCLTTVHPSSWVSPSCSVSLSSVLMPAKPSSSPVKSLNKGVSFFCTQSYECVWHTVLKTAPAPDSPTLSSSKLIKVQLRNQNQRCWRSRRIEADNMLYVRGQTLTDSE